MTVVHLLEWARGPLFKVSLWIFSVGMLYRFFRVLLLGWKKDYAPPRGSALVGVIKTYVKSLLIFPFLPPKFPRARHRPLTYIAGGLFHVGLFVVLFLLAAHIEVWHAVLGLRWPALPTPVVDGFAVLAIVGLFVLASNRVVNPVTRMLTSFGAWLDILFVMLPLLTGWATYHHIFGIDYTALFTAHMLTVDWLLIWIPFSRISHFMTYFITKTMHGIKFGRLGVEP